MSDESETSKYVFVHAIYGRTRGPAQGENIRDFGVLKIASFLNSVRSIATFVVLRPARVAFAEHASYLVFVKNRVRFRCRQRVWAAGRNFFTVQPLRAKKYFRCTYAHHNCRTQDGRILSTIDNKKVVSVRTNVRKTRHTRNNGHPAATSVHGVYGTRQHNFRTRSGDLWGVH